MHTDAQVSLSQVQERPAFLFQVLIGLHVGTQVKVAELVGAVPLAPAKKKP